MTSNKVNPFYIEPNQKEVEVDEWAWEDDTDDLEELLGDGDDGQYQPLSSHRNGATPFVQRSGVNRFRYTVCVLAVLMLLIVALSRGNSNLPPDESSTGSSKLNSEENAPSDIPKQSPDHEVTLSPVRTPTIPPTPLSTSAKPSLPPSTDASQTKPSNTEGEKSIAPNNDASANGDDFDGSRDWDDAVDEGDDDVEEGHEAGGSDKGVVRESLSPSPSPSKSARQPTQQVKSQPSNTPSFHVEGADGSDRDDDQVGAPDYGKDDTIEVTLNPSSAVTKSSRKPTRPMKGKPSFAPSFHIEGAEGSDGDHDFKNTAATKGGSDGVVAATLSPSPTQKPTKKSSAPFTATTISSRPPTHKAGRKSSSGPNSHIEGEKKQGDSNVEDHANVVDDTTKDDDDGSSDDDDEGSSGAGDDAGDDDGSDAGDDDKEDDDNSDDAGDDDGSDAGDVDKEDDDNSNDDEDASTDDDVSGDDNNVENDDGADGTGGGAIARTPSTVPSTTTTESPSSAPIGTKRKHGKRSHSGGKSINEHEDDSGNSGKAPNKKKQKSGHRGHSNGKKSNSKHKKRITDDRSRRNHRNNIES